MMQRPALEWIERGSNVALSMACWMFIWFFIGAPMLKLFAGVLVVGLLANEVYKWKYEVRDERSVYLRQISGSLTLSVVVCVVLVLGIKDMAATGAVHPHLVAVIWAAILAQVVFNQFLGLPRTEISEGPKVKLAKYGTAVLAVLFVILFGVWFYSLDVATVDEVPNPVRIRQFEATR